VSEFAKGVITMMTGEEFAALVAELTECKAANQRWLVQCGGCNRPVLEGRIRELEVALRELRRWITPVEQPAIFRSGVGTQLLDRIDEMLGSSAEPTASP
jgi:hypothetical protein